VAPGAGDAKPVRRPEAPPAPRFVPGGLARGDGAPADAELLEGDRAYDRDDLDAARQRYRRAQQLAPKDPAPRVGLARVALAGSGIATDYAVAPKNPKILALLRDLDAALKLDKAFGPAHVERGRVLLILGRAEEALKSLERGVEFSPRDPEAHSALGVALLATGRAADALERLKRAAELDPNNAERLTNLGTAYMMRGKVAEAIQVYERAVQLDGNDARAQGDHGTAYIGRGVLPDPLRGRRAGLRTA
jgi:Flp pilus assembly protein TadD